MLEEPVTSSSEPKETVGTWNRDGSYHEVYKGLGEYPPKALLDRDLVNEVINHTSKIEGQVLVAELGAGPAPISNLLNQANSERYKCEAFDLNPEMTLGKKFPFAYTTGFDLTDPNIAEEEIGKYDVVTLENSLYTVSMAPDGTRKFTQQEAYLMKQLAFNKAAAMLKPGGVLIMSDPLPNTGNFGLERIISFLQKEQEAEVMLGGKKSSLMEVFMRRVQDKEMKEILSENKKLMERVVLSPKEEMEKMIKNSQLFEEKPLYIDSADYLGSNYTVTLKRNENEVTVNSEVCNKLDSSVMIEGIPHPRILSFVGDFRKRVYAQSGTTEQLPKQDKFDNKDGLLLVYLSKNKPGIAAVSTLQPRGDMGLDAEELMSPDGLGKDKEFYNHIITELEKTSPSVEESTFYENPIQLGEVRRLATDNLDGQGMRGFFKDMARKFVDYSNKKKIDIILFLTEPDRAKFFNGLNGITEFKEVKGFKLNRQPEHQTMMLCAANYFFGDLKASLGEEDAKLVEEATHLVGNKSDWREAIKGNEKEQKYTVAIEKLFEEAPDNVSIYFSDYPLRHKQ